MGRRAGARIVYIRPAPVFGPLGPRSFALPEFDPFWEAMQELNVIVGLHNTVNRRYPVDVAELDGTPEAGGYFDRPFQASAFRALVTPRSQTSDLIASMVGHGMLTRFPRLKVVIVEHFNEWTRPMLQPFPAAYERSPILFDEDPLEVLRRNVWIHIFHDNNPLELISMLGVANSMFGSDFPHPEGLRDPLTFSEEIATLPIEDQELVMGGNSRASHESESMKVDVQLSDSVIGAAERATELEALGVDGVFTLRERARPLLPARRGGAGLRPRPHDERRHRLPAQPDAPRQRRLRPAAAVRGPVPPRPRHPGQGARREAVRRRWGRPVAQMREWVLATKAILEHWQDAHPASSSRASTRATRS